MNDDRLTSKGPKIGLNIGASSILVVFILLCLVTFSVLSLVSANADYKLSKKIADHTQDYYIAVSKAQEQLCALASTERNSTELADFTVPLNASQEIHVIAKMPMTGSGDSIEIMSFKTENIGNWEPDNTVQLYDPELFE